jgi:hypothetical protein
VTLLRGIKNAKQAKKKPATFKYEKRQLKFFEHHPEWCAKKKTRLAGESTKMWKMSNANFFLKNVPNQDDVEQDPKSIFECQ